MSRRTWTPEQDKSLKTLKQALGSKKWAVIARKLNDASPTLSERTGKQCRERYHNHLDENIGGNEWNQREDALFLKLYEQVGNKWSVIARGMPGKTDNSIKNHFYSRLRKSTRKINRVVTTQKITMPLLYHIVEAADSEKIHLKSYNDYIQHLCRSIRRRLFLFSASQEDSEESLEENVKLIEDINRFRKMEKKLIPSAATPEALSTSEDKTEVRESDISSEKNQLTITNQSLFEQMKSMNLGEGENTVQKQDLSFFFFELDLDVPDFPQKDKPLLNQWIQQSFKPFTQDYESKTQSIGEKELNSMVEEADYSICSFERY